MRELPGKSPEVWGTSGEVRGLPRSLGSLTPSQRLAKFVSKENRYGRYGFASFSSIPISTVGVDGCRGQVNRPPTTRSNARSLSSQEDTSKPSKPPPLSTLVDADRRRQAVDSTSIPSDTKLLLTKNYSEIIIYKQLRISRVILWKCLSFPEILRAQNPSKITKNKSQGIIFAIISCQRVDANIEIGLASQRNPWGRIPQNCCGDCWGLPGKSECWGERCGVVAGELPRDCWESAGRLLFPVRSREAAVSRHSSSSPWAAPPALPCSTPPSTPIFPGSPPSSLRSNFGELGLGDWLAGDLSANKPSAA